MSVPRPRRARAITALVVASFALGLAGCAEEPLPEPQPEPVPAVPPPTLTVEQNEVIIAQVGDAIAKADSKTSTDVAKTRLTGPAKRMRDAEYTQAAAGVEDAVTPLSFEQLGWVSTDTTEFPRFFLSVGAAPPDGNVPRLYIVVQSTPRSNYRLWAWTRMLGGASLPVTANPAVGSMPIAADDTTTLLVSPAEAMNEYVDLLNKGSESAFASAFEKTDSMREQFAADQESYANAVKAVDGAATWTHQVGEDGVFSVQAADGTGIVTGTVTSTLALTIAKGKMDLSADVGAFAGATTFTKSVTMTYESTVTLRVPPAGSDAHLVALAGERVLVGASGS